MALAAELERTHRIDWSMLGGIPEDEQRQVMCNARRRRFVRDDTIFYEGDPGDTLHLLRTGHVAVKITTPVGDVATLTVLGPGDFFGEFAVLAATASRSASVVCLDQTETLSIHRGELDELRRRHPSVSDVLLQVVTLAYPQRRADCWRPCTSAPTSPAASVADAG
jgi:CRP/FNR family transcriptional regulator, cyclic AMP receptor protein